MCKVKHLHYIEFIQMLEYYYILKLIYRIKSSIKELYNLIQMQETQCYLLKV